MIKFFGLNRQYQNLREELADAAHEVLQSGQVLDGPHCKKFEKQIAYRCNRTYALTVNSGTQALIFAQQFSQSKTESRDKILIPNLSFIATLNSVIFMGNTPIFCDVDKQGLLDINSLDFGLSNSGINAVMYVNLFGNIIDYNKFITQTKFFNKDLYIIEDAAQSFGASYKGIPSGKLGTVSCLSFDPTKNLPNYGSGGMILTDDKEIAEFIIDIRDNGKARGHIMPGTNSKMSEIDCAQMLVKLKYFDEWQRRRSEIASYYSENLENLVSVPEVSEHVIHAWHKYVIKYHDRNTLQQRLYENNIETKIHYNTPLHDTPLGFHHSGKIFAFNESIAFTKECISLPIYPELTDSEVEHVVDVIKSYIL